MSLILPSIGAFGHTAAGGGPQLVGTAYTTPIPTGGATISLSGFSLQENDLVLIRLAADSAWSSHPVTSSGYTAIRDDHTNVSPANIASYKIMGATPDTEITVGPNGRIAACIVQAWRGIDTTTPLDGATPGNTTTSDPPAVTTNTAGAVSVIDHYLDDDDVAGTGSAPSGWIGFTQADTGQASTDALGSTISTAYQIMGAAGSVDPGSWTGLNTDSEVSLHFILRAAT